MTQLAATIAAAAGVFAGTNVDDLLVLILLFIGAKSGEVPVRRILAGQYLGFGALVAASVAIAIGLTAVPTRWVGLVGLIPLAIGIRGLLLGLRDGPGGLPAVATRLWSVAGIAIANGSDNLSVYAPLLRTHSLAADLVLVLVLLVGVAVWCALAYWLCGRRRIIALLHRIGFWLVPLVFIAIGLFVLLDSSLVG